MASSSSLPRTWKYNVFTSFHGPDVRRTFLSHLRKQFSYNGITMFDDNGIERSHIIGPALTQAIRESRISIVVLTKNYASSSWCLDELLEILKYKEDAGQIVMTVFHGVDTSDVRKQIGDFGIAFKETCACRTEEEEIKWSHALSYVGNIAGEDFKNWDNEAKMIEKIARDVSDKLNVTPSRDFEGMVGLEAHLRKVESLLDLHNDGVKMVGISGPAGIGKSTIARALHSRLSSNFPLSCFMDNLRGSYHTGFDVYGLKLRLQEQLLSKILNLNGMTIHHLGVIKDRLHDQKVLIILDDVDRLDQLEALANIGWFGHGSRIIVTTENKEILLQHGMNDIYPVGFPSGREALKIFCLSAFSHTSPPYGFIDLACEVVKICGNLPFGLHVLGSSLRGKNKADWIDKLPGLKKCLDGRIESVLKVGYEILDETDQDLFLHIAVFFNYEHVDHVTSMLEKSIFDVRLRLKALANKHLIHIDGGPESRVVMQRYLQAMARQQVMARQAVSRQEPWKQQILVDAQQICYVLENAEGNGSIVGVAFNVAEINELKISARAFERMSNLNFLKVYGWRAAREIHLHIPEEIEFPRRLRLLHWEAYPRKSLPLRFCPENLVELHMVGSKLEKLWEGTQRLATLKIMNLSYSSGLKELPDLSKATNLERLDLSFCTSVVKLPSAVANLHKLDYLQMNFCENLEVIPTLINLACLEEIDIIGCLRLRSFPDFPTNITKLIITGTAVEEMAASIRDCSRLEHVDISGSINLTTLTHLPKSVTHLKLSNSGIERITDCIKDLQNLQNLQLSSCQRLVSLPQLPSSLEYLKVDDCKSLERVSGPLSTPNAMLDFTNCFKLDREARRAVIQGLFVNKWAVLPGRQVPTYFNHRARGNSLTIPHSDFNRFKVCLVISLELGEATYQDDHSETCQDDYNVFQDSELLCRCIDIDVPVIEYPGDLETEHLMIFNSSLPFIDPSEVCRKIVIQFRIQCNNNYHHHDFDLDIIECGIQILTDETDGSNNVESGNEDDDSNHWVTHESEEANSESGKAFDKENDEEENKSEQAEEDDDDGSTTIFRRKK